MASSVVLLKKFNAVFPQEVIDKLPKEMLILTVRDRTDFNRYNKEYRTNTALISIANQFPDLFSVKELPKATYRFDIRIDDTDSEYLETVCLKPKIKTKLNT